jgi:formamidopyrimidine-DNA glycosylase
MPELPEVETVRRGLEQATLNQRITAVEVLYPRSIGAPDSYTAFQTGLQGCEITGWFRRGKYLYAMLIRPSVPTPNAGGWLGVHLRMSGQLLWLDPSDPLQVHTRVRLMMEAIAPNQGRAKKSVRGDCHELRFVDQRTFGQMWWVPPDVPLESVMTGLQRLGPEPFAEEFSVAYLQDALAGRVRSVKSVLLDQQLVAGVGNIYADEALFLSRILPMTRCCDLNAKQIRALHQAIREVLARAIAAGGTTFSTFTGVMGVNGNYGGDAWVYGRKGEACRQCGSLIEQIRLVGRSAHFCPLCQR